MLSEKECTYTLDYNFVAMYVAMYIHTVDLENFIAKKVTRDKSFACFNFVKAESIVCTSTEELCMLLKNFHEF